LVNALEARFKGEPPQARVIVNKFSRGWWGDGLRKRDAMALLGDSLAAFVPEEQELVTQAINQGDLAGVVSQSNRLSRELTQLIFKT
jgi:Flp pilus assembly CpaE family ATPase